MLNPQRLSYAMVDTGKYFDNTEKEVHALLVTNFEELKEVLFDVLDQSGDILEKSLANAIQEVTLDNLTDSLDELGSVRSHLKTIKERTEDLQELVQQLDLGLKGSKGRLQVCSLTLFLYGCFFTNDSVLGVSIVPEAMSKARKIKV